MSADQEIRRATESLRDFTREVDSAARSTESKSKTEKEAEKEAEKRRDRITAAGVGAVGAAGDAAFAGDFDAGIGSAVRAGINAVRGGRLQVAGFDVPVGEVLAQTTGLNRADSILGGAAGQVAAFTGEMARYNVEVPDDFRTSMLDRAIEENKRVEQERARVMGEAFSAGNVAGLTSDQGRRLLAAVEKLANTLSSAGGQ